MYRPPTGAHCDELLKDLGLTFLEGQRTACHEQLKWIHEFGFKGRLRRAQHPTQAQINAALDQIIQHLRHFLNASEQLHLDWRADQSLTPPGPMSLFWLYPRQLRALADHASSEARHKGDFQLGALARMADRLADYLTRLDHASVEQISKQLHEGYDYAVRDLTDAVRVGQRLEHVARTVLEKVKPTSSANDGAGRDLAGRADRAPRRHIQQQSIRGIEV